MRAKAKISFINLNVKQAMDVTWSFQTREEQLRRNLAHAIKDRDLAMYQCAYWSAKSREEQSVPSYKESAERYRKEADTLQLIVRRLDDMIKGVDVTGEIEMGTLRTQFFKVLPTASSQKPS